MKDFSRRFFIICMCVFVTSNIIAQNSELERKAQSGNVKAQHDLAVRYLYAKEYDKAFFWEKKAAEKGDVNAQCNLGLMYNQGWGCIKNIETSIYWYKRAIEGGSKNALFNLGSLYVEMHKYEDAINCLQSLAEKGDVDAQSMLGSCYSQIGNYDLSLYWRQKAIEGGSVSARFNMGIAYMKGYLGAIDYDKAINWFEEAAQKGHKLASHNLSVAHYEAGKKAYEDNNWAVAFSHFTFSAESKDNPIPDAMRLLSACYKYERGTPVNETLAYYWMQEAAKHNNPQALELLGDTH